MNSVFSASSTFSVNLNRSGIMTLTSLPEEGNSTFMLFLLLIVFPFQGTKSDYEIY